MDIGRINLAQTPSQDSQIMIHKAFAEACFNMKKRCPLLIDLQGPMLRIVVTGDAKQIKLKRGNKIYITANRHLGPGENLLFCDCKTLSHCLKVGAKILIDKGKVSLTVKALRDEKYFNFKPKKKSSGVAASVMASMSIIEEMKQPLVERSEYFEPECLTCHEMEEIKGTFEKRIVEESFIRETFNMIINETTPNVPMCNLSNKKIRRVTSMLSMYQ